MNRIDNVTNYPFQEFTSYVAGIQMSVEIDALSII